MKYHPESWSQQAREMSNEVIENVNCGAWCLEQASRFFYVSYKHPLVKQRAAKRFFRKVREGKVHESPESIKNWEEYKEKYHIKETEEFLYKGHWRYY